MPSIKRKPCRKKESAMAKSQKTISFSTRKPELLKKWREQAKQKMYERILEKGTASISDFLYTKGAWPHASSPERIASKNLLLPLLRELVAEGKIESYRAGKKILYCPKGKAPKEPYKPVRFIQNRALVGWAADQIILRIGFKGPQHANALSRKYVDRETGRVYGSADGIGSNLLVKESLNLLLENGFVEKTAFGKKQVYTLTEAGIKRLQELREHPPEKPKAKRGFKEKKQIQEQKPVTVKAIPLKPPKATEIVLRELKESAGASTREWLLERIQERHPGLAKSISMTDINDAIGYGILTGKIAIVTRDGKRCFIHK
ncbi:MAG: hypothetical protein QXK06_03205 [Candidatus Diapherotrites archaeon]